MAAAAIHIGRCVLPCTIGISFRRRGPVMPTRLERRLSRQKVNARNPMHLADGRGAALRANSLLESMHVIGKRKAVPASRLWLLCACFVVLGLVGRPSRAADSLRVMTFNVRYPAPNDGPERWELRRDLFVKTVREQHPDVFGTQELYKEQGDYVVAKLPGYKWLGMGRKGDDDDEHMGVFYRTDELRVLDSGNFW